MEFNAFLAFKWDMKKLKPQAQALGWINYLSKLHALERKQVERERSASLPIN
jgi:hypothetical protein